MSIDEDAAQRAKVARAARMASIQLSSNRSLPRERIQELIECEMLAALNLYRSTEDENEDESAAIAGRIGPGGQVSLHAGA